MSKNVFADAVTHVLKLCGNIFRKIINLCRFSRVGTHPQTSVTEVKHRSLQDGGGGGRNGRINSTKAGVDHMGTDQLMALVFVIC